ncbi:MAG: protoporphyrinogen oxidase [candidate division Zixibacteria bacterium]|nr:protoporphyrinogen oxidase [candidate division Zixibacteria bacterium]NIW39464.1 protoporphyrinogen oxidase [candidate division Zixibacteria bacterium]NIX57459.1 protoporphyrinogen oxidase [candidate division Zixibacteria bacterium]
MNNQINTDVGIIGAGISGLASAHFLNRNGIDVHVIEKNSAIGGSIRSERRDGFLVEYGPNSALDTTPILHDLFSQLGIDGSLEYASEQAKNRYIVRNGKLIPLPMSPPAFIKTKLFSASAKLGLLKEPFIGKANPEADESLAEFVMRRLGNEFLDYAINPFVAGVYAGNPDSLSVKSAFPKLYQLEQEYGSLIKGTFLGAKKRRKSAETSKSKARLFSFKDGLQTIIQAIGNELENNVSTNAPITAIRKNDAGYEVDFSGGERSMRLNCRTLLFTIPAYAYNDLRFEFNFQLHDVFAQIYYPPVTMVFLGFKQNPTDMPLDGFGFLVPEKETRQILGTIWSSTIFSNRALQGGAALTTFVGGSRQPEIALKPDDELTELVFKELHELMGLKQKPELVVIKKWEKAIPQYNIGHKAIIEKIEQFEAANDGIFISGNFRGGISVADCVKQAFGFSKRINAYLEKTSEHILNEAN